MQALFKDWIVTGNTESAFYLRARARLRPGLWIVAGLSAIISVLMLAGSIYMLQVYDRVLSSGSVPTLMVLFGLVVLVYGFLALYDGLRMRLLSRLSLQLDAALAGPAFRADLLARQQGRATQASMDLDLVRHTFAGPAMLALFDLPFTMVFVAVLFIIHPLLGLLTLAGMALAAFLALLNGMVLNRPMQEAQHLELPQRMLAESVLASASSVAALGMRKSSTLRWLELHHDRLAVLQKGQEPSEVLGAASRALRMLLQAALLTAAAWLVLQSAITVGAIIAASILSGRALAPVDQLIGQWRNIVQARAADRRLRATEWDMTQPQTALPQLTGAIEVENLTRMGQAAPGEDAAPVLDKVSFQLAPGEGLGIIGPSGSGKSTLARLIVGAIAPDSGRIRFDGATAAQWDPDALGRQIGYLPQRIDLLPGTVRDNIARFDPGATDEAVLQAAKDAGVHEMILHLPKGYDTPLVPGEMPLSGGQVQRIGLARALYGNPRILVLDEPNAHLDNLGEAALARALAARRKAGVSVIVCAHRLGALMAVERLMVLEEGRVTQDGPRELVLAALRSRAGQPSAAPSATPSAAPRPAGMPAGTGRIVVQRRGHLSALHNPAEPPEADMPHKATNTATSKQQAPILLTPNQKVC